MSLVWNSKIVLVFNVVLVIQSKGLLFGVWPPSCATPPPAVVRTRPLSTPLATITMRKSTHNCFFLSYESMGLSLTLTLWATRASGCLPFSKKSGNFGWKSNVTVIFRKIRLEIVDYLQRQSSFSVWNGIAEISLPFAKLYSFQSFISRKQLWEIKLQMVSAIS